MKITQEDFVFLAIRTLPKPGKSTVHTVYSGFNEAFRKHFGEGSDPIQTVNDMHTAGKIAFRIARGGAIIGLPGSIENQGSANGALIKMGL
jgi:hypothetical protein